MFFWKQKLNRNLKNAYKVQEYRFFDLILQYVEKIRKKTNRSIDKLYTYELSFNKRCKDVNAIISVNLVIDRKRK